jgi:Domain of unknown function (DUF4082)/Bacterial Ig-like domain/Bacterial Ig domain
MCPVQNVLGTAVARWMGAAVGVCILCASIVPGVALSVLAADPCLVNPIPCENQLPGTAPSIWSVSGAGDPSIQGFATDISVNVGGTITFKVKTSSTKYSLTVYRMGFYQGNGARQIAVVQPSASLPQKQPACLTDPATALFDCGNWGVSASWAVPAGAVSGIYFAKLVDAASGAASQIPFIVRNDSSSSDVLFRTADTTWEAYNDYGGSNLYYGTNVNAPAAGTEYAAGRAFKVSYNRPFNDRSESSGYGTSNYLFYAEYPTVRWLEANGYNVSYFTSVDLVRYPNLVKNHKVLMSAGHDEYWSNEMRSAVQSARDAGVDIANFTGNEDFWKTRWENSIDGSNTADRTLVCYKETLVDKVIDPMDPLIWSGSWRDPSFSPPADGGKPENSLGGTIFTVNKGSAAPVLDSTFAKLRFWRNTAVASLQSGQTVTLGAQTIGYEWDSDVDNGFRPGGLVDLSATSVAVPEILQDYGLTYGPGTAVHSLTLYRAKSGALVFSAGSVQWVWGLDVNHDTSPDVGPSSPDLNMEQSTVNLLADMGVQPATLQAGLVATSQSTDVTPPTSTVGTPSAGTTLTSGTPVTISGTAADAGGGVVAGVEVSTDGGITWHPARGTNAWTYIWTPGAPGTATIESRATDDSANIEAPTGGVAVTINPRTCPCSLIPSSATPATPSASDSNSVELGVKFYADQSGWITGIKFYKGTSNTGTHVASLWTSTGTLIGQGTFSNETATGWQTYLFPTPVGISANTTYIASYHAPKGGYAFTAGYFDSADDAWPVHAPRGSNGVYQYAAGSVFPTQTYNSSSYWVDVIYNDQSVDTSPPVVTGVRPSSGSVNTSPGLPFTATLNKNVAQSSLQFTVADSTNTALAGTVGYNSSTFTATFTPNAVLPQGATLTATVNAIDTSGNAMSAPFSWSFTTAKCPCSLFQATAAPAVPLVADNPVEVGVKFQTDTAGWVNGIRFYKGAGNSGTHIGDLWSSSGQLLASATFTGETASGWQQVLFATPVQLTANTTYIASYHTTGGFGYTSGGLGTEIDAGPLHAPSSVASGGNGVYAYSANPTFPNQTYNANNYYVDVTFTITSSGSAPAVTATTPTANATGVSVATTVSLTFNESVVASSLQFAMTGAGAAVPGTLTYNNNNFTATFKPSALLVASTPYTATLSAAADSSGNNLAGPVTWSFTTGTWCSSNCTVFAPTAVPAVVSVNDSNSVELGMTFTADVNGSITTVRFYKGTGNTGTHVGSLWTSGGQPLAQVTFTNETASGWQQATFSQPVAITAGAVYVVSYHTTVGFYSASGGYFASATDNPPLHAVADGTSPNGVYLYGSGSAFPNQTFNATNYWVDVVFTPA